MWDQFSPAEGAHSFSDDPPATHIMTETQSLKWTQDRFRSELDRVGNMSIYIYLNVIMQFPLFHSQRTD